MGVLSIDKSFGAGVVEYRLNVAIPPEEYTDNDPFGDNNFYAQRLFAATQPPSEADSFQRSRNWSGLSETYHDAIQSLQIVHADALAALATPGEN